MLKRLTITFSPEEREALDQIARRELRPAKDQVRLLVREAAERRGLWPMTSTAPQPAAVQLEGVRL